MYTYCPTCARQFRIRASQLAEAEGLVQCGFCGMQFNALDRLYDKPLVIENESKTLESADNATEPELSVPEVTEELESPESPISPPEEAVSPFDIDRPDTDLESVSEPATPVHNEEITNIESDSADYPFPDELAQMQPTKTSVVSIVLWRMGVLILLLAGTVQAAWFNRDYLLSEYPQFLPRANQVCGQLDCTFIRHRNIAAIKLLNRDVRVHPRYEDALLVNATISNQSKYAQRFPSVLLSLFDPNDDVIAYRLIPASEYLDSSINIKAGMKPDTPIYFVLEVANSTTEAVSFEFDFL